MLILSALVVSRNNHLVSKVTTMGNVGLLQQSIVKKGELVKYSCSK